MQTLPLSEKSSEWVYNWEVSIDLTEAILLALKGISQDGDVLMVTGVQVLETFCNVEMASSFLVTSLYWAEYSKSLTVCGGLLGLFSVSEIENSLAQTIQ